MIDFRQFKSPTVSDEAGELGPEALGVSTASMAVALFLVRIGDGWHLRENALAGVRREVCDQCQNQHAILHTKKPHSIEQGWG